MHQLDLIAADLQGRGLEVTTSALMQMAGRLRGQAAVMSFIDIFLLITVLFAGLAITALLMRKPALSKAAASHQGWADGPECSGA